MASLREMQRSFAAALRDPAVVCAVQPTANLAVYRNNGSITFREALEQTFPVVQRRVGDDYFRQLSVHYRQRFPSRSGDLHWTGRDFAGFLDDYLAGGEYHWLADLARIEWARAECSITPELPSLGVDSLTGYASEALERLVFGLQPSLHLLASAYPVYTVWLTNQVDNAPPVNQSQGPESGMIRIRHDSIEVRKLDTAAFAFISALANGSTLGDAMTIASIDARVLTTILAFLFGEGMVSSLTLKP
jgi:hypothetical protein